MEEELARRRERLAALRQGKPLVEVSKEETALSKETSMTTEKNETALLDRSLLSGTTVEGMAAWLMAEAQTLGQAELKAGQELTLEQLAPGRPNADLRREWERRQEPLMKKTERAIAKLVRERLLNAEAE